MSQPEPDVNPTTQTTSGLVSARQVKKLPLNGRSYDLPFGRGQAFRSGASNWQQKFVGGRTLSEIATLQSGFPFTLQLGFNPTNNGDSRNPIRPSVNPDFHGQVIQRGPTQYFNPHAFIVPILGTYGNLGRNTLTGPGVSELDLSVRKNTALTNRVNLQLRAEFFNILNRTNFGTPNTVVYTSDTTTPSPTAGLITTTSTTSRQIQFGAKLLF